MVDTEMNQEENAVLKPQGIPESIKYHSSVGQQLNKCHDKKFIRQEESKLYELISSLPEAEIEKLEDELTIVPKMQPPNATGEA